MAIKTLTNENFDAAIRSTNEPVLLDFWASWCGPCRQVAPALDAISAEQPELMIGKINVDEQPELAARYQITSIPTLLVLRQGQVAAHSVGAVPKRQIEALLGRA